MKWLLSQCRYWSGCVGFLYTVVTNMLLGPGKTKVSRKGSATWFGSSTVNCICGSCELMCVAIVDCVLLPGCQMCHPHILAIGVGMWGRAKGLDFELFHEPVGNEGANGGTQGSTMGCNTYPRRGSKCF